MKLKTTSSQRADASLLDLLVMLIAVAIVVMVGYAYMHRPRRISTGLYCVNHLKQVGLSFRIWAVDNGDKYPAQVSTNAGGTMELVASGVVFPHFAVMSNELATPKIIVCPQDAKRISGTNFATLSDANVSYFVVPEADEIPQFVEDERLGRDWKMPHEVADAHALHGRNNCSWPTRRPRFAPIRALGGSAPQDRVVDAVQLLRAHGTGEVFDRAAAG